MEQPPIKSIYQWYYDAFLAANWGLDYNNIWFVSIYPQDGDLGKFLKAVGTEAARFDVKSTGVDEQGIVNGYNGLDLAKMVETAWNYNIGKLPDNCNIVGADSFGGNVLLPVTNVRIPKDTINTQTVEMGAGYTWVPPILADKHPQFAPLVLDMYYTAYPFGEFVIRPWSMAINRFGLKPRQLRCNICCSLFTKNNHYLARSHGNNWAPKFEYRFYSCYPLGVPEIPFSTDNEELTKTTSISFGYDFYRVSIPNAAYIKPLHNSVTDAKAKEFSSALKGVDRPIPGKNFDDGLPEFGARGGGVGKIFLKKSKNPLGPGDGDVPSDDSIDVAPGNGEAGIKQGADDAINTIMGNGKPPVDWTYTNAPPGKGEGAIKGDIDEVIVVSVVEPKIPFFDEPIIPLSIQLPVDGMDDPIFMPVVEGRVGGDEPGRVSVGNTRATNDEPTRVESTDGERLLRDDPDSVGDRFAAVDEEDDVMELLFEENGQILEDEPSNSQVESLSVDENDDPNDISEELLMPDEYDEPNNPKAAVGEVAQDEPTFDMDVQTLRLDEDEPNAKSSDIKVGPVDVAVDVNNVKPRGGDDPDKMPNLKRARVPEDDLEKVRSRNLSVRERDIKVKIKTPTVSDKDDLKELKFKSPKEIDGDEPDIDFVDDTVIDKDVADIKFGDTDAVINDEPVVGESIPDIVVFNDEPGVVGSGRDILVTGDEPGAVGPERDILVTGDEPGVAQPQEDVLVVGDEPNYPALDEVVPRGDEPPVVALEEKRMALF